MEDAFSIESNETLAIFEGNSTPRVFRIQNFGPGLVQVDNPDGEGAREMKIKAGRVGYYTSTAIALKAQSGSAKGTFKLVD